MPSFSAAEPSQNLRIMRRQLRGRRKLQGRSLIVFLNEKIIIASRYANLDKVCINGLGTSQGIFRRKTASLRLIPIEINVGRTRHSAV